MIAALKELVASFDAKAYLATKDTRDHGENWSLEECPGCGEDDKLWVYVGDPSRKPQGTWICFKCDESGSAIDLIRLLEGCDLFKATDFLKEFSRESRRPEDLRGAVERALSGLRPEVDDPEPDEQFLPPDFVPIAEGVKLPSYFAERGIGGNVARYYGLGYCAAGRYRNRLVVPVTRSGGPRWWLARWMAKKPPRGVKKYLNSPGSSASRYLYSVERHSDCKEIVLVEDVFSAIHMRKGVVATFGTHFSKKQLALLAATSADSIVIAWDRDALDKAWLLASALSELWQVRVLELPDSRDLDEHPVEDAWSLVRSARPATSKTTFSNFVKSRLGSG